jgi:hypothetical protein
MKCLALPRRQYSLISPDIAHATSKRVIHRFMPQVSGGILFDISFHFHFRWLSCIYAPFSSSAFYFLILAEVLFTSDTISLPCR